MDAATLTVTEWFISAVRPVHTGVYQIRLSKDFATAVFSFWNGQRWSTLALTPDAAATEVYRKGICTAGTFSWRGLATSDHLRGPGAANSEHPPRVTPAMLELLHATEQQIAEMVARRQERQKRLKLQPPVTEIADEPA